MRVKNPCEPCLPSHGLVDSLSQECIECLSLKVKDRNLTPPTMVEVDEDGWVTNLHFIRTSEADCEFLWFILHQRMKTPDINISHLSMPDWLSHKKFVKSNPYAEWWIVKISHCKVGHCYITKNNEIGIFLMKKYQGMGLGKQIVQMLLYHWPAKRVLANIAPKNEISQKMFSKIGFNLIQYTYAIESAEFIKSKDYEKLKSKMERKPIFWE